MDRAEIEAMLHRLYAMREANDLEGALESFAPQAIWRTVGDPGSCSVAGSHRGAALRPAMQALFGAFRAIAFRPTALLIDGDRAVATVRAELVFTPTGERINTEIAHVWSFADGKVTAVDEFLDTALAARLLAGQPGTQPA